MTAREYIVLKERLIEAGYAQELDWAADIKEPRFARDFFYEIAWVIVNSGMKAQVAQGICQRVAVALTAGERVRTVFNHPGKAKAIQDLWDRQNVIFAQYKKAGDKLEFLEAIPWIGPITKWHAAKNLGMDVCKPDRHLLRIAAEYSTTPIKMCYALAEATCDRIALVDTVIWRAANLGWI